ncbi:MAG: prephenate dehydratase [Chloroflexi bacterium]|nr:prephenate dehydratase [Chloroflexota bacterium]
MKVSIQGYRGSFHDIVAREKFGDSADILERGDFRSVFEDVRGEAADFGIVAIENSIVGSFLENYDLLLEYNLEIVGELYLRIILNLIVLPGVKMNNIENVYSHPRAIQQCVSFLNKHPKIKRVETDDTAGSVKMIKETGIRNGAAIASGLSAQIYGMEILEKGIETDKKNYTRFLVISREPVYSDKANKTSMVIRTDNRPGSLCECLKCFADEGINLSKIESRPIIGKVWQYYFYLDFEEGREAAGTKKALRELNRLASMVKILGSYERGIFIER